MEVKHWYYDTCWWKQNYFNEFFAVWTLPFFQHIPGKSFRLKLLMYVWNTFRGHIKLQKDFRWTVWRSNIDIKIYADEIVFSLIFFCSLDFTFLSIFQVKVFCFKFLTFLNMICPLEKHGQLTVHVSHKPMGET